MTTINSRTYWPNPGTNCRLINTFNFGIVQTYTPGPDLGSVRLRQRINGVWDFDWFYRLDQTSGVLEYRDDYPKKWYNYIEFWKGAREVLCVPGKEIYWGNYEQVGASVGRQCQISGILGHFGWQELKFENILQEYHTVAGKFNKVLVLTYWQDWGTGRIDGAKMWLAPSTGPIRWEWMLNGMPTGYWTEIESTKEELE